MNKYADWLAVIHILTQHLSLFKLQSYFEKWVCTACTMVIVSRLVSISNHLSLEVWHWCCCFLSNYFYKIIALLDPSAFVLVLIWSRYLCLHDFKYAMQLRVLKLVNQTQAIGIIIIKIWFLSPWGSFELFLQRQNIKVQIARQTWPVNASVYNTKAFLC